MRFRVLLIGVIACVGTALPAQADSAVRRTSVATFKPLLGRGPSALLRALLLFVSSAFRVRRRAYDAVLHLGRTGPLDVYRAGGGCHRRLFELLLARAMSESSPGGSRIWRRELDAAWAEAKRPEVGDPPGKPISAGEARLFESLIEADKSRGAGRLLTKILGDIPALLQAETNGWVVGTIFSYADGAYTAHTVQDGGQLEAWKGYWILSDVDATLIIPPTPAQ